MKHPEWVQSPSPRRRGEVEQWPRLLGTAVPPMAGEVDAGSGFFSFSVPNGPRWGGAELQGLQHPPYPGVGGGSSHQGGATGGSGEGVGGNWG